MILSKVNFSYVHFIKKTLFNLPEDDFAFVEKKIKILLIKFLYTVFGCNFKKKRYEQVNRYRGVGSILKAGGEIDIKTR